MATSTASGSRSNQLIKLGNDVWLQEAAIARRSDTTDPDLVLVFGWMNGKINHVQKYTEQYKKLFPQSEVLLVMSKSNIFWKSEKDNRAFFQPVITQLVSRGLTRSSGSPRLHVHTFSNGGAIQLISLIQFLQTQQELAGPLPASTFVMDSLPGGAALRGFLRAFTTGLKSPFSRYPAYAIIVLIWLSEQAYYHLLRPKPYGVRKVELDLRNPELLPVVAPRLYIYSQTDELMPPEYIEEHIARARQDGCTIETEAFGKSPHVAHARTDPERYWGSINAFYSKYATKAASKP